MPTHVGNGPHHRARLRDAFSPGQLGQAEVEDLHDARLGDQQVSGFDVPMDDFRRVSFSESLTDLGCDVHSVTQIQRPTGDPLLERLPLVVGHDEIQLPVVRLVDLEDGADVGVVQCGGGLGFLEKPLLRRVVSYQVRRQ